MDGTTFGKLIVDVVLAYFIGKSTWNKTQSSGKTTVVVIIALISPLIAWIISACFSPAEQRRDQTATTSSNKTEASFAEAAKPTDLIMNESSTECFEENTNNETKPFESYAGDVDNLANDPVDDNKNRLYEGAHSETVEQEYETTETVVNQPEDKQSLIKERLAIKEDIKPAVFCRFCGVKLNDGARFCHKCGKKVG